LLAAVIGLACPGGIESRLGEIRALQESGRFDESVELLREILVKTPYQPEANYLLGIAFVRTGQPNLAIWPLRKAILSEELATEAGAVLAAALVSAGNFEEAIAAAREVVEKDPSRADAWTSRAQAHIQLRDLSSALEALDGARAGDPDDVAALLLRAGVLAGLERLDDARAAFLDLQGRAEGIGNVPLAARGCTAVGSLHLREDQPEHPQPRGPRNDTPSEPHVALRPEGRTGRLPALVASPRAEATFRACFAQFPGQRLPVEALTDYLLALRRLDDGLAVWREAAARAPQSLDMRVGLANQLWIMDRRDEAKQSLREATQEIAGPEAWEELAELHRLHGEYEDATRALGGAFGSGGDQELLRFKRASLVAAAGNLDDAEALVESFDHPAYRNLLRGQILLARGEPRLALEAFDAGLANWPDNAVARAMAGRAARQLGDPERALAEYRESVRADARATDAGLAAAQLAYALGRYDEAAAFASDHLRSHPYQGPAVYRVAARAALAAKMDGTAHAILEMLARQPGGSVHALVERAWAARTRAGPAAEAGVLKGSGLDLALAENEPALRALVGARIAEGRANDALARVDRAVAKRPENADLLALRGRVLLELDRDAQARIAFETALAQEEKHSGALAGLGLLVFRAGDAEQAFDYLDRATRANPDDEDAAFRTAQILMASGRSAEAEVKLRELLLRAPGHADAANDLAWLLAQRREDLDFALALAERAATQVTAAHNRDTLAFVQLQRGDPDAAMQTLEEALEVYPRDATLRYRLGLALLARGDEEGARTAIRESLAAGSFPEAEAARSLLAQLEAPADGG
jgi:tetratricopeptide (TPR) repeat protein